MAKAFSLASWNVEHFQNASSRVDRVVSVLTNLPSLDVFALYEVEGAEVFGELVSRMPGTPFTSPKVLRLKRSSSACSLS